MTCVAAICVSKASRVAIASSTVGDVVGPMMTIAVFVGLGVLVGLGVNDGVYVGRMVDVAVGTPAV